MSTANPASTPKGSRRYVTAMLLLTVVSSLALPVNPWPEDGWFSTQDFLAGDFEGMDNYTPIAAPAFLYAFGRAIAEALRLGPAGEFYVGSLLQNALIFFSGLFVYRALTALGVRFAGPVAMAFLLLVLSTGLPQAFWSESVVLFLMSAALFLATLLIDPRTSGKRFALDVALCALCIGALVVTRMTPALLIPVIAWLMLSRVPRWRVGQFFAVSVAVTIAMMLATMHANDLRFGRFELTNSTGRHLWQGVREFTDRALRDSPEYHALKALSPEIEGKNWWELPFGVPTVEYTQDAMLERLAKEAIRNEPLIYISEGIRKFIGTIGDVPFRLGFVRGIHDPIGADAPLPPLADSVAAAPARVVQALMGAAYALCRWLYPVSISLISISLIVQLSRTQVARDPDRRRLWIATAVAAGLAFAMVPFAALRLTAGGIAGAAVTLACLAVVIRRAFASPASGRPADPGRVPLFVALAALFFGSLWFSWQLEDANSRNAVPYLPFWAAMLALAADHFGRLWPAWPRAAEGSGVARPA